MNIFVSVGATSNEKQEAFVRAVEDRLRSEGLVPQTVGRNAFSSDAPLKKVVQLLDSCQGTVVIALERTFYESGVEKRGSPTATHLSDVKLPTPWNQIEAAMSYSRRLPLMVLVERGLKGEGLLERGSEWYVQSIDPVPASLTTNEFNGVLADWKSKVECRQESSTEAARAGSYKSPADLTIRDLLGGLRPAQLWSMLAGFAAAMAGAFALGLKFTGHG
jgi:hypothetical protein